MLSWQEASIWRTTYPWLDRTTAMARNYHNSIRSKIQSHSNECDIENSEYIGILRLRVVWYICTNFWRFPLPSPSGLKIKAVGFYLCIDVQSLIPEDPINLHNHRFLTRNAWSESIRPMWIEIWLLNTSEWVSLLFPSCWSLQHFLICFRGWSNIWKVKTDDGVKEAMKQWLKQQRSGFYRHSMYRRCCLYGSYIIFTMTVITPQSDNMKHK
jgi:hypothetical protein